MLKRIKNSDELERFEDNGKLKIFLGYSAGVGKTYHMLDLARDLKSSGRDVAVGYIENHDRKETRDLLSGMEIITPKQIEYGNMLLLEPDLEAIIKRNPEIVLIDECAHTKVFDSSNSKRYRDIEALLKAGISVYTTLNIQHIKSLNEVVKLITNIQVKEIVPDTFLNRADNIELIDIEPSELIDRMNAGKIYKMEKIEEAQRNFFAIDNLIKLREIALKYMSKFVQEKQVSNIATKKLLLIADDDRTLNLAIKKAKVFSQKLDMKLDVVCLGKIISRKTSYKTFDVYYCKKTEMKEFLGEFLSDRSVDKIIISRSWKNLKSLIRVWGILKIFDKDIIIV